MTAKMYLIIEMQKCVNESMLSFLEQVEKDDTFDHNMLIDEDKTGEMNSVVEAYVENFWT